MASQIPLLIANKGQDLIKQMIPKIIDIAQKTAIENIGQLTEKLPDTCLIGTELQKILNIRNQLINKLNTTSNSIKTLSSTLNPLTTVVNTTEKTLQTVHTTRIAANITLAAFPGGLAGAPGIIPSSINIAKDLEEFLTPQITTAKGTITSIKNALDFINNILVKLIRLLSSIDNYLAGCGVTEGLVPLNGDLQSLNNAALVASQIQITPNSNTYQGFTLEIVEVPYSPTVNRKKAVAKNRNGIILLQTPLSFTTTPQVLINEIKLIIDSNNLKAD